jgi:hypothetical protein
MLDFVFAENLLVRSNEEKKFEATNFRPNYVFRLEGQKKFQTNAF